MPLLFHSRKTVRVAGLLAGLLQDMLSQAAQDASERHDGRRKDDVPPALVLRMLNGRR